MRYKLESESRDQDDADHHSDDDADDDIYISAIWRGADDSNVSLELHSNFVIIWCPESENHLSMGIKEGCVLFNDALNTFCLTTHSTHFIYGYMVSGIW